MAAGVVMFGVSAVHGSVLTQAPSPPSAVSVPSPIPPETEPPDSEPVVPGPVSLPKGYTYTRVVGNAPILVDACLPVVFQVDTKTAPSGAKLIVQAALDDASSMTGLMLVNGNESEAAGTIMTIKFRYEANDPGLSGDAIGVTTTRFTSTISGADIRLEDEWFASAIPDNPELAAMVVLHEIGHALGLGHDDEDVTSIMYPYAGAIQPNAGDRQAFRSLNTGCQNTIQQDRVPDERAGIYP